MSVDMPETYGFNAVCHTALVTVQGGSHFSRLAVLTEVTHVGVSCGCCPSTAYDTGHLHNCIKSRWKLDTRRAMSCTMFRPTVCTSPLGWGKNRALQSRRINSSSVCLFDIPDTDGPLPPQCAQLLLGDGRPCCTINIHEGDIMEPPGHRSVVRY